MPKVATDVDPAAVISALLSRDPVDYTEGRVLAAAGSHLLARGLLGFEVDAIAEVSGVARSTIYRRFGSRNQLIAAAVAHETERFFSALAEAVSDIDDPVDQVVAAFSTGLRLARDGGFAEMIRTEPQLVELLTVEGDALVTVATTRLVAEAERRMPDVSIDDVAVVAELLVRLAASFVVTPASVLDLDDGLEDAVRSFVRPLLASVVES